MLAKVDSLIPVGRERSLLTCRLFPLRRAYASSIIKALMSDPIGRCRWTCWGPVLSFPSKRELLPAVGLLAFNERWLHRL